jgi:methylated-DNA-[protein]-cysteine S-methyltransferase
MTPGYQAILPTPFAALGIRANARAVTGIDFLPRDTAPLAPVNEVAAQACAELQRYLDDPTHRFQTPLELHGTPYQLKVWHAIAAIPAAQPLSYGELASRIGSSPRAVGQACGSNPIPIVIPCHRVLAKGGLGGFMHSRGSGPLDIKQWLLRHEAGE